MTRLTVHAQWDSKANVWVATSDDVPGLATEAATQSELVEKLNRIIPELLALNGMLPENQTTEVPVSLHYEQDLVLRA